MLNQNNSFWYDLLPYHHWFEEFVKSKHICDHFFQMKVHFRIYLIVWIVGSSQILLDCVWPFELRFYWKNESSSFSDDRDMKRNEVIHYVWSGDWVEARSALCRDLGWKMNNWNSHGILFLSLCWFREAFSLRSHHSVGWDIVHLKLGHDRPVKDCSPIKRADQLQLLVPYKG